MSKTSLTEGLVARINRPVASATRARAALHWIDWMACVAAGSRSPVAQVLRAYRAPVPAAQPVAALLGQATDGFHAVLLDAGPANIEEMDDMHREAILHPGPVIMPAIAALIRQSAYTPVQVLDSIVRGYEVMIRIGRALGPSHYYHWHNTATAGAFGAAAACASLLKLSPAQTVWALGNAGTQAAGLWQARIEPVMSKQLHTAHAAWAGLTAACLAQAGFTGASRILEGERGFFAAMCADHDSSRIDIDEPDWLIHETSFKPWPACRHTHASIDCMLELRQSLCASEARVGQIDVYTFNDALSICDNPSPASRTEAKFSLQYCVAAAAILGPLLPEHFDESFIQKPELKALASRVRLHQHDEINRRYPAHFGARVEVTRIDGTTASASFDDSLGDPERALSDQAVLDKARNLFSYGAVDSERAAQAIEAAAGLLTSVSETQRFPTALTDPIC